MASKRVLELLIAIGGKLNPELARATGEAGKQIDDLVKKQETAAKTAKLQREQTKQLRALEGAAHNMSSAWGKVGASIIDPIKTIAKAATAAGVAAYGMGYMAAQSGANAVKMGKQLGMTTRAYSELAAAAQYCGVDQDTFAASTMRLNKVIAEAAQGNKAAIKNLEIWGGVTLKDAHGKIKGTEQVMLELSKRFQQMPNATAKSALAMQLFGRQGATMVPLLEKGPAGIAELRKEMAALGMAVDDASGAEAQAFMSSLKKLKFSVAGLGSTIGTELLPFITPIQDAIVQWRIENNELIKTKVVEYAERFRAYLPELKTNLIAVKDTILSVKSGVETLVAAMGGWGNVIKIVAVVWAGFKFFSFLGAVGNATASTLKFIAVLKTSGPVLALFAGKMFPVIKGVLALGKAMWALALNPTTWIILGIVAAVVALGAAIYLLWKNWDKVWAGIQATWESFTGWFAESCANITAAFDQGVINGILELFKTFNPASLMLDALNGLIKAIFGIDLVAKGKEWIGGFTSGMLDGIKGAAGAVGKAVSGMMPSMQGVKNFFTGGGHDHDLQGYAAGGIVTRPQLAMVGEAGPEAIIPLSNPSRAMELLGQAARSLGMESPAAGLTRQVSVNNAQTNVGGPSFSFSPQVTVNGGDAGSIRQAVDEALRLAQANFEKWARNMSYQENRVAMR